MSIQKKTKTKSQEAYEMKHRGIIFQGWAVRAILGDLKTQTRRPIKPQISCEVPGAYFDAYNGGPQWNWWDDKNRVLNAHDIIKCPWGIPGDGLYVRETWQLEMHSGFIDVRYFADNHLWDCGTRHHALKNQKCWVKRPSIHMPKWASRIDLEILNIRVQRIQDITIEDIRAEGVSKIPGPTYEDPAAYCPDPWEVYADIWNSIYQEPSPAYKTIDGKKVITHYESYPWDESDRDPRTEINGLPHHCYPNPYVWAIDFKRIERTQS